MGLLRDFAAHLADRLALGGEGHRGLQLGVHGQQLPAVQSERQPRLVEPRGPAGTQLFDPLLHGGGRGELFGRPGQFQLASIVEHADHMKRGRFPLASLMDLHPIGRPRAAESDSDARNLSQPVGPPLGPVLSESILHQQFEFDRRRRGCRSAERRQENRQNQTKPPCVERPASTIGWCVERRHEQASQKQKVACHRRRIAARQRQRDQLVQTRLWRELGMPIFWRYLVIVRRATLSPCFFSSLTRSSSLKGRFLFSESTTS